MRKLLLVIAAAMALFTVGAFAASFGVSSEDIASGGEKVEACADKVNIDFDDPLLAPDGAWSVNGATVTFTKATAPSCVGFVAELAVVVTGTNPAVRSTAPATVVAGGTTHLAFVSTPVATITGASAVVGGQHLTDSSL